MNVPLVDTARRARRTFQPRVNGSAGCLDPRLSGNPCSRTPQMTLLSLPDQSITGPTATHPHTASAEWRHTEEVQTTLRP